MSPHFDDFVRACLQVARSAEAIEFFLGLILLVAVMTLQPADKLFALAVDLRKVIVGQLTPCCLT